MSEKESTQSLDTKFKYFEQADVVNSPTHYNFKGIEAIDAIEASMTGEELTGYLQSSGRSSADILKGNCMKYLWRYKYKGKPVEDLKKCQWYLNKLIASVEKL